MMTMNVLNTSDAECTASDTMAPERASSPAASFAAESSRFTTMLTPDTRSASLDVFSIRSPPDARGIENRGHVLLRLSRG